MKFTGERFIPLAEFKNSEIEIEHLNRYYSVLDLVDGKRVLDISCGSGYGAFILSQKAQSVIAVDIDEEAIRYAKQNYSSAHIEFKKGHVVKIPAENKSIDIVISFETIEHIDERLQEKFLLEIKRVLASGGILVISTPDKKIYSDYNNYHNKFHIKEFYRDEFYNFLIEHFQSVDFLFQDSFETNLIYNSENKLTDSFILNSSFKKTDICGKYLIAICSESKHSQYDLKNFNSLIIDQSKNLHERYKWIQSMQAEIEHLGKWGKSLDDERNRIIHERDSIIHERDSLLRQRDNIQNELNILRSTISFRIVSKLRQLRIVKSFYPKFKSFFRLVIKSILWPYFNNRLLLCPFLFNRLIVYYNSNNFSQIELNPFGFYIEFRHANNKIVSAKLIYDKEVPIPCNYTGDVIQFSSQLYFPTKKRIFFEFLLENGKKETFSIRPKKKHVKKYLKKKHVFPICENPLISIIIPSYNNFYVTFSCLCSLLNNISQSNFEILIADDNSTDETKNITKYFSNIRHIRNTNNLGFLKNCNNASSQARGRYIVFLNNDTNILENWLESLLELIENDSQIGMVGSKLIHVDGTLQEAGGIIWKDASGCNYGYGDDSEKPEYNYIKESDYISGASIMIRKDIWDQIGGFDERYTPAYYEDTDLAFEVRKLGYKVIYQPFSRVIHFEGMSHGKDINFGLKAYQKTNQKKFYEKWKEVLEKDHFSNGDNIFSARDRTKNKKTILVIDHYVPEIDKDAGSKSTYHQLLLFLKMGLSVKFLPDNFFHSEPHTTFLEKIGIEVLCKNWSYYKYYQWLCSVSEAIDFVYLSRPHIAHKHLKFLQNMKKRPKIFYYGQDLHYLREMRQYEVEKNKAIYEKAFRTKQMEYEIFNNVDVIYFPSEIEVQEIKSVRPDINVKTILPFVFNSSHNDKPVEEANREGIMFVGGFAHKPNIDGILWFFENIWPSIQVKLPDVPLYIVGSNPTDDIKALNSKNVIVTGYVSDEVLENYYQKIKVVIAPLRYGAGIKGKIAEAMSKGIPVVTTSIGAEGFMDVEDALLIADDADVFAKKLIELYKNKALLKEISNKSKTYIKTKFSMETAISIIKSDFI